ncbi:MAG: NAD(+)/NADH kinase [Anaerolineae bacterium]|nr:NAD(+)/NADH kinase [Anaerolineae bacterium]
MNLSRVGILGHPLRSESAAIGAQVETSLKRRGIEVWQRIEWEPADIEAMLPDCDLVIAIGGDGAMLRVARLCGMVDVPVLGINVGHLGFLTETDPVGLEQSLDAVLAGNMWIEERMMIRAEIWRDGDCLRREHALNDIVIGRGASARLVLLDMYIDGDWATTYYADALIVSTPTGSTAYSLAVGGPILTPELKTILVVPVAPHLTLDRPLVLSEGVTVEVVVSHERPANVTLTVDGDSICELEEDDAVVIHASEHRSRFVRLRDHNYFYRSLLDRMEPKMPVRRRSDYQSRVRPESKVEGTL